MANNKQCHDAVCSAAHSSAAAPGSTHLLASQTCMKTGPDKNFNERVSRNRAIDTNSVDQSICSLPLPTARTPLCSNNAVVPLVVGRTLLSDGIITSAVIHKPQ